MGFWLWKYFKSQKSFDSDAQTEVFDLPKKGIISNLIIETYAISGSTKANIMSQDIISKVEVIGNGSTVIQSLSGKEIQASQAWDDGQLSVDKEMSPSGGCYGYFDIRFGRYPGDQKYALDCSKWDSLELKITYNLAAGGTLGTTGYTTATGKLTIYGLYSPDGAGLSPVGYLKKAQKKIYTTSAGGSQDLELPTDYPFRRLILLITTNGYLPYQAFQYVTININNGARKPIDNMMGNDLMNIDQNMRGNPLFAHIARYYLTSGLNYIWSRIGWIRSGNAFRLESTLLGNEINPTYVQVTAGANCAGHVDAYGLLPEKSLCIDLEKWSGGKDGHEAMMDVFGFDEKADIHLEHTQQTASIASQVVLEQYATK